MDLLILQILRYLKYTRIPCVLGHKVLRVMQDAEYQLLYKAPLGKTQHSVVQALSSPVTLMESTLAQFPKP